MNKKFMILTAVLFCAGCRIGVEPTEWEIKKIGKKIQTNPVYLYPSEDYQEISTDLKGEEYSRTGFKVGLFKGMGDEKLKLNLGADVRFNLVDYSEKYKDGFHQESEQVAEDLYETASVFTQVVSGSFTYIPFVGLDFQWSEDFSLGFEVGFPYAEWEAYSGHHYSENDDFQESQKDFWKGFGLRYAGSASFKLNDSGDMRLLISAFHETYNPEFAGEEAEIFGSGIFIGLQSEF
ncbi:MAG: hypothetical protein Q8N58_02495 [bacterium]|nr:hypothetical protein [bacterium]